MNAKVVDEAGFTVIGIEACTSNATEMTPEGVIAKQWARFMQENLAAQIPDKTDSSILAVYTDYASDQDGEYTFVIDARVDSAAGAPPEMVVKKIPAGRYAVFTSDKRPGRENRVRDLAEGLVGAQVLAGRGSRLRD